MSCQRGGLTPNALHQIAVRTHGIDVVVEDFKIGTVEVGGQPLAADGHSKTISNALAKRTCSSLHTCRYVRLRVSWSAAAELPESLDFLQGHRQFIQHLPILSNLANTGQMQHGIEQHRRMPVGQNEAVAIHPLWIRGIVT